LRNYNLDIINSNDYCFDKNNYIATINYKLLSNLANKEDLNKNDIKEIISKLLNKGINTFTFEGFSNLNKYSEAFDELSIPLQIDNIIKGVRTEAKNKNVHFDYKYYGDVDTEYNTLLSTKI
jgi:hypothetical protein